jgi:histidinol-phosphate aminotransferase
MRFRPVVDALAPYVPGGGASAPGEGLYRLSANESPFGPLPSVLQVIAKTARSINRYPDNGATELIGAISRRYGIPGAHVAVGCGSVGVAQQLLAAVGEPGSEVIYPWRSFEAYPILTELAGATSVRVPLRDDKHDLSAMAAAISDQTRLIFVCNPNNPTGTVVRTGELTEFLSRVPRDCLVVLDEAYAEYVRDPDVPCGLDLYRDRPNVAVLRTFSKAYGLAGLRVGFLVGHDRVTAAVRATMLPFSVNALAQAAAVASLAAEAELLDRVSAVVAERDRVRGELLARGWTVPPSEANFLWLRHGARTADFADACAGARISVRPFPGEGARITIGDHDANDAFLGLAQEYRQTHTTGLAETASPTGPRSSHPSTPASGSSSKPASSWRDG